MKKYVFLFMMTSIASVSLVSCSTEEDFIADETILEDEKEPEVLLVTESLADAGTCQTCISSNPDLLPQYLCDNGDGTFTIDDTASIRTKAYPKRTNFNSLIRAMESGNRFACE